MSTTTPMPAFACYIRGKCVVVAAPSPEGARMLATEKFKAAAKRLRIKPDDYSGMIIARTSEESYKIALTREGINGGA